MIGTYQARKSEPKPQGQLSYSLCKLAMNDRDIVSIEIGAFQYFHLVSRAPSNSCNSVSPLQSILAETVLARVLTTRSLY